MGISRTLNQLRRRYRVFLTFVAALSITACFAYYNGYQSSQQAYNVQNEPQIGHRTNDQKKIEKEKIDYPLVKENVGEIDTSDLYWNSANFKGDYKETRTSSGEKLKVFVLPFTHVDPGWLRTFSSYSEDTDKILTNMHTFMMKNEKMRFMWAEFVFFETWWKKQTNEVKQDVRKLVAEGRLELASGSWVMTDEANAYFPVSVDNIVEGHQFVKQEFGRMPTMMWSNDPFGYSNSVPYLFKLAGINRTVINRIHHGIKHSLQQHKGIPFRWRQYFDENGHADMLTHVLPYTHYDILNSCGPNPGACCEFDFKRITHWSCPGPKPVPIDSKNIEAKANTLVGQLKQMSSMYEAPVLLMVHGDDFRYDMIEEWHQQHDNFVPLFDHINKGNDVEIRFGTFEDYFTEMENWYQKSNKQPPVLTGDFFPYQCALGDYWTGYFTTRPFYKRQGRLLHSLIRSADLLSTSVESSMDGAQFQKVVDNLTTSRRTLSLFQHHDAITGTSKVHVMQDYSNLLHTAIHLSREVIEKSIKHTTGSIVTLAQYPVAVAETQTKLTVSLVKAETMYAIVYNSLPYPIVDTVSIRIDTTDVHVLHNGQEVVAQIEPYTFKGTFAQKTFILTIPVTVEPLSFGSYQIKAGKGSLTTLAEVFTTEEFMKQFSPALPSVFTLKTIKNDEFSLENDQIKTSHDSKTGILKSIKLKEVDFSVNAAASFSAYKQSSGGAYVMRGHYGAEPYGGVDIPRVVVKGSVQQTAHLFHHNIYQRMSAKRVPGPLGQQLEVHLRVDIQKEHNLELVMSIETDIKESHLFVDSVGLQLLRRKGVNGDAKNNYYPMPSAAVLQNKSARLTVSSNVEHGLKPLDNGMEIMIDRILNQDDGKGLGYGPDSIPTDLHPVDMMFSLLVEKKLTDTENPSNPHFNAHTTNGLQCLQNVLYPPLLTVSLDEISENNAQHVSMPCDYQLLTNRYISPKKRLLTIFRHGIAPDFSTSTDCGKDVNLAIRHYLKSIGTSYVQVTNLSGTDDKTDQTPGDQLNIQLKPFEFLSLLVTVV